MKGFNTDTPADLIKAQAIYQKYQRKVLTNLRRKGGRYEYMGQREGRQMESEMQKACPSLHPQTIMRYQLTLEDWAQTQG